jgi:hypothetical protein
MRKVLIIVGLLLVACGGSGGADTAVTSPKAETITCTAAYRSSVEVGIEREETLTFTGSDAEQSVAFADITFHAAYSTGELDNERSLRLWVTRAGEDMVGGDETAVSHSTLYQFPPDSGPQNQFMGGHGFTGLNYSYHPGSGAEMQFWCEAG